MNVFADLAIVIVDVVESSKTSSSPDKTVNNTSTILSCVDLGISLYFLFEIWQAKHF